MRLVGGWASDRFVDSGADGCLRRGRRLRRDLRRHPALDGAGTVAFLVMAAALGAGSGATFALIASVTDLSRVGG